MSDISKSKLSKDEIKKYLKDMKSGDTKSRAIAAYMLGTAGKKDKSIRKSLIAALKDKNWEVRKWAALSLGEIGEKENQLVPILIDILKRDDSKEFRSHAAVMLGELEIAAITAMPALCDASKDENTRVRDWACWAIGRIAGDNVTKQRSNYPSERPKLSDRIRIVRKEK
jgi:HEAT repeat protein